MGLQSRKQILQNDDYTDQSMDLLYPGSIPLGLPRNPEVAQEAPAQGELSQFNIKDETRNPETPEEISSSLLHQETVEEYPEEEEPSLTEQQAPAPAPQPFEQSIPQTPLNHEVTVQPPGEDQPHLYYLPSVTAKPPDMEVTITSEPTKEAESSSIQQETPTQPPEHPEEVKPSATQEETPTESPGFPAEAGPPPSEEEQPPQTFVSPEETEPSQIQQEATAQTPEYPMESITQTPSNEVTGKPPDVEVTITSEPVTEAESSSARQGTLTQPPENPEEVKPSAIQEETPIESPSFPGEAEPSPSEQEQPPQPFVSPGETEPSQIQQEATAQAPESPMESPMENIAQTAPNHEVTESPMENMAQTPSNHEVTVQPPGEDQPHLYHLPNVTVKPPDVEVTITSEPTKEAESSSTQQETPTQPPEHPEEVKPSATQEGTSTESPGFPTEAGPPASEQEQTPQPFVSPAETEPSSIQQEVTAQAPESPMEIIAQTPPNHEVTGKPPDLEVTITSEPTSVAESSTAQQEIPTPPPQPYVFPGGTELSQTHQEATTQAPETTMENVAQTPPNHEVTVQPPGGDRSHHYYFPNVTVKPPDVEVTITSEPTKEAESSSTQKETPTQPPEHPEEVKPSAAQEETSAESPGFLGEAAPSLSEQEQPPQPFVSPGELEPSQIQQAATAQTPESPMESISQTPPNHEVTDLSTIFRSHSTLPTTTVKHVDLELTISTEPTSKDPPEVFESSLVQQEAVAQTPDPPKELELSSVHQEAPAEPLEPLKEVGPSGSHQEALGRPPKSTEEVRPFPTEPESPAQPPELPKEVMAQPPMNYEMIVPTPGLDQAHYPALPRVTLQPLDMGITITPEVTTGVEHSSFIQETPPQSPELPKEVVAQPQLYQEVTVITPGQDQAHYPALPSVPLQPADMGLTVTPEPTTEVEHSSIMQETPPQPPELPKEVVVGQPQLYQEVTVITPGQDQAHYPALPSVPLQPVDMGLTVTPEPTTEVENSSFIQETPPQPPEPSKEIIVGQPQIYQEVTIITPGSGSEYKSD
ncbi:leucine-rich repeat-containing protein 37A2-like [Otolemur garnettii]|uniref:leucine-rich repeat-containing protein 37A2-like n=1 Tax=Otolemur garnettii TaxID=30611 RepID=UPI000C7E9922|nr:leucine-rich repeat-containing protein 37A2-like [Otolemur garnettii]